MNNSLKILYNFIFIYCTCTVLNLNNFKTLIFCSYIYNCNTILILMSFLTKFIYYQISESNDECSENKHIRSISKKERYFWQYNVQAKGPKGQRLILKKKSEDPHILNSVTDPVFSPSCSVRGIKHR